MHMSSSARTSTHTLQICITLSSLICTTLLLTTHAAVASVSSSNATTTHQHNHHHHHGRCRLTRGGRWCALYHNQQPVPAKLAPAYGKTCPANCSGVGVCNAMIGQVRPTPGVASQATITLCLPQLTFCVVACVSSLCWIATLAV